ncbi:hypothetical protein F5Y03DRAFT_341424 [Xylaria venustula]|nr:hypothetical protein F5Y03DRAFT_341424 [Xylaria venustula]
MSSMLKKTGGLTFKPKAGRRPGAGAPKPPASSTSTTTTRAPTAEPQSQAATPAASDPSTPSVVESVETAVQRPSIPQTPTDPLPTPASTQNSAPNPNTELPVAESASISPPRPPSVAPPLIVENPTPQPSDEVVRDSSSRPEPREPNADSSRHDPQPTSSGEPSNNLSNRTPPSPGSSVVTPTTTSGPSRSEDVSHGSRTAPPSPPPVPEPVVDVSGSGEATQSQTPAPKKSAPRRRKSTRNDSETNTEDSTPKKKRQRRKSSAGATTETGETTGAEVEKPTRRRKRDPTPENAEELTVDHSTMTVGELTKDLGIGKRFKHAEEIEQRAREARARNRLKRLEREKRKLGLLDPEDEDSVSQRDTPDENGETRGAAMAQLGASMEAGAAQGVGYDVVDGQIVVHAASLVVDRHAQDMSTLEVVEENDFTNLVNSSSFAKRVQTPGNWTDEDTEKFYRLLGMFGTDFETISRLFPGKNRRAVKLKFNKEERLRPNRINAAMMVRGQKKVNIDIEEYKASQRQWQAKDKILEEQAKLAEEHEREVSRLREERRAAGLIDDDETRTSNANTNTNGNAQGNGDMEVIEEDADALGQGGQDADVDMEPQPEAQPEGV